MDILFPQNGASAGGDLSGAGGMRGVDDLFYSWKEHGDSAGTCDPGRRAVFPRDDGLFSHNLCLRGEDLAVLFCGCVDSLPEESAVFLEPEYRKKRKGSSGDLHCGCDLYQCVELGGCADEYVGSESGITEGLKRQALPEGKQSPNPFWQGQNFSRLI